VTSSRPSTSVSRSRSSSTIRTTLPGHPEQIYCRSDHYNYARYGIPIVFLTTGLHDDYHAPSDRPELIDYDKLARVSSLVYDLTVELANRPDTAEGRPAGSATRNPL
jgi:Iap family predicted aminopeptidase